ncbi:hypothetical protein [Lysobacter sp. CA199]|uniref:hypothetical protein n=1 Tax=Lysobacter sp. CA199 TaxID=3455608 RepID=UPI003F8D6D9A
MNTDAPAHTDAALPPALRELLERELSPAARGAHVGLLLLAAAASAALAALWLTEPALAARTQAGFALLLAINLSWCVYALWALRHRRVLYARHRLIAARMASAFCALYSLGAFALAMLGGLSAGWFAGLIGLGMTGVAAALQLRARRHYAGLQQRRAELERAFGPSP